MHNGYACLFKLFQIFHPDLSKIISYTKSDTWCKQKKKSYALKSLFNKKVNFNV